LALLWSGEPVQFHGRYYDFDLLHFAGAPKTAIPLVFGGHGPAALRRAARRGSGWFGPNIDLDASLSLTRRIDELRSEYDRDGEPFAHSVRRCGPATPAEVERYAAVGFEHLVFCPFNRLPRSATLADRLRALDEAREALAPVWEADQ